MDMSIRESGLRCWLAEHLLLQIMFLYAGPLSPLLPCYWEEALSLLSTDLVFKLSYSSREVRAAREREGLKEN